jgi:transposase-like protein
MYYADTSICFGENGMKKAIKEVNPFRFEDLKARFASDDDCRAFLFQQKWPLGFVCPNCGHTEYYEITKRHTYQCKNCRHQTSVTVGTVMDKSHLSLSTWVWAIYLVSRDKRGYSAMQLSRTLNLSYNTAWYLLHRIRHAMTERNGKYLLAGVVELDDTYFGGAKKGSKRGRGTKKTKVIVAISKDVHGNPLFAQMKVVNDLTSLTISRFAGAHIKSGAIVRTDAYSSYRKPLAAKYLHDYKVFDADSEALRWLHTVISNSKSFVQGTFHGLDKKHLQSYLDEFCYRFNRRKLGGDIYKKLLSAVVEASPIRYAELTT